MLATAAALIPSLVRLSHVAIATWHISVHRIRLVVSVRDPDHEVLTRRDQHAVDVRELYCGDSGGMEVEQADLLATLDVPAYDLLLGSFTARNEVAAVRTETSFEDRSCAELIELSREFVLQFSFEGVDEDDRVLGSAK